MDDLSVADGSSPAPDQSQDLNSKPIVVRDADMSHFVSPGWTPDTSPRPKSFLSTLADNMPNAANLPPVVRLPLQYEKATTGAVADAVGSAEQAVTHPIDTLAPIARHINQDIDAVQAGTAKLGENYAAASDETVLDHTSAERAYQLERAYDNRSAAVEAATGIKIPTPGSGGLYEDAVAAVKADRAQAGLPTTPDGPLMNQAAFENDVNNKMYAIYQQRLVDAAKSQNPNTPMGQDNIQAIGADRPVEQDMPGVVKAAQARLAAAQNSSGGYYLPAIAAMAGSVVGGITHDPLQAAATLISGPEGGAIETAGMGAASKFVTGITEAGARNALTNLGITMGTEPIAAANRAALGEENGWMPVLKDAEGAALSGFIPGAVLHGIIHIGDFFGRDSPAVINEFLRTAAGGKPNPEMTEAVRKFNAGMDVWKAGGSEDEIRAAMGEGPLAGGPQAQAQRTAATSYGGAANNPLPTAPGARPPRPVFKAPDSAINTPSVSSITPTAIRAAEDGAAAAPPRMQGFDHVQMHDAYGDAVAHGQDPQTFPPLVALPHAPSAQPSSIPPDRGAARAPVAQSSVEMGKPVTTGVTFQTAALGTDPGNLSARTAPSTATAGAPFDPSQAGTAVVFQDANGRQVVVDGNARQALAASQGHVMQDGSPTTIQGTLLKASDGWTEAEAREVGARKNIQEGRLSGGDTAQALRDHPNLWDDSLPPSKQLTQAKGIANLADAAHGMMQSGGLDPETGSLIGRMVQDPSKHAEIAADVMKARLQTPADKIRMIHGMNGIDHVKQMTASAFGDQTATKALIPQRLSVMNALAKMMNAPGSKVFAALDKLTAQVETNSGMGPTLTSTPTERAAHIVDVLTSLANSSPEVSAMLNRAARSVANGQAPHLAAARLSKDLGKAMNEGFQPKVVDPLADPEPNGIDLSTPEGKTIYAENLEAANRAMKPVRPPHAAREIFDDIREKMIEARMPEAEADANAALMEARYETRAVRLGMDPENAASLYKDDGWRVGGTMGKPLQKGFIKTGRNLQTFINDHGGLREVAELVERVPARLLRKTKGMSLDQARQMAAEHGYLGANIDDAMADTTPSDFFRALVDNHPTYPVADLSARSAQEADERMAAEIENMESEKAEYEEHLEPAAKEVDKAVEELGWPPLTHDVRMRAADLYSSGHEPSIDNAIERAMMWAPPEEEEMSNDEDMSSHWDTFHQSPVTVPTFYSAVGRAIDAMKQAKATPEQWAAAIRNIPGVKPEELKWLGLEDWLKGQKGAVTKEQVADYVRDNNIQVQEVEHGQLASEEKTKELQAMNDEYDRLAKIASATFRAVADAADVGDETLFAAMDANKAATEARDAQADKITAAERDLHGAPTKYPSYTLPGGENYRELLLTLPPEKVKIEQYKVIRPDGHVDSTFANEAGATARAQAIGGTTQQAETLDLKGGYKSSHWDEPNILAHIRFDDRTVDGQKALHIAEVQSDWHQEGRRKGYGDQGEKPRAEAARKAAEQALEASREPVNAMLKAEGYLGFDDARQAREAIANEDPRQWGLTGDSLAIAQRFKDAFKAAKDARAEYERIFSGKSTVPDAPFKTSWPELSMKRMIRYAAENGYHRITWDTGATNAERYDLSKQVSKVALHGRLDSKPTFVAHDLQGKEIARQWLADPAKELPDLIGKDAAEKLLNQDAQYDKGRNSTIEERSLSGDGLRMGGQGMTGFYDKILPAAVNKLVKKFGGKVEEAKLTTDAVKYKPTGEDNDFEVKDKDGNVVARYYSEAAAEEHADRIDGSYAMAENKVDAAEVPVHSLTITPALHDAAIEQGFPLFQGRNNGIRGSISIKENQRLVNLFANGDPSTFPHETAHAYLVDLVADATGPRATKQLRDDLQAVMDWLGVKHPEDIKTEHHEKFAGGYERYLAEGVAPSARLARVFEQFKQWMLQVYRRLAEVGVPINDAMRGVFDRMMATEHETHFYRHMHENPFADLVDEAGAPSSHGYEKDVSPLSTVEVPKELAGTVDEGKHPTTTAQEVLARPEVVAALAEPRTTNKTFEMTSLTGSSKDGKTIYISKSVPKTLKVGGQSIDPSKYLAIHEHVENALRGMGMKYYPAHVVATVRERAQVEADGVDWPAYQTEIAKLSSKAETGEVAAPPPDLAPKPYAHTEAQFQAHEENPDLRAQAGVPVGAGERLIRTGLDNVAAAARGAGDTLTGDALAGAKTLLDQGVPKSEPAPPAPEGEYEKALRELDVAKTTHAAAREEFVNRRGDQAAYTAAHNDLHAKRDKADAAAAGLKTEKGADGKDQTLIPGVAPVTDVDRLRFAAGKPLRGGNAPMDIGMFDDLDRLQQDLYNSIPNEDGTLTPISQIQDGWTREEAKSAIVKGCQT